MKYLPTMLAYLALALNVSAQLAASKPDSRGLYPDAQGSYKEVKWIPGAPYGAGVTYHHKVTLTNSNGTTTAVRTSWIIYNLTANDQLAFHGPDLKIRYGPAMLHKSLSGTGAKIGATTPNYYTGGGGGIPPKHDDGPSGTEDNGFMMYKTNWTGATSATWMRDPVTCGTVFYSQATRDGAWSFNVANFVPCPSPSPVPSSSAIASPTIWDLIVDNKDGGPLQGEEITNWTPQMELDYYNVYGVMAKH